MDSPGSPLAGFASGQKMAPMSGSWEEPSSWWQRLRRVFRRWRFGSRNFSTPENPALVREAVVWFAEFLESALHLPTDQPTTYREAAEALFTRMTPIALRRVREYVKHIEFYTSLAELTVAVGQNYTGVRTRAQQGRVIGGAFDSATGQMWLDGLDEDKENDTVLSHYAHEFGHALDGPERQISGHALWKQAWRQEICRQQLSPLAHILPKEGLAEFARVMYTGEILRVELERYFPLCVEVWKGFAIW